MEKALIEFDLTIQARDVPNTIQLPITGTGIYPVIAVSREDFPFGECPVNDRRDFLFELQNKSPDLGIDYSFSKIAHFKTKPTCGRLAPLQSTTVLGTFMPTNLG